MADISSDIIISTGMMEQCPGLYGSTIKGRFFRLEHVTPENVLLLSMGATSLSEIQRTMLENVWNAAVRSPQTGPVYSDHFVSLMISVEADWVKFLNNAIDILTRWADENEVKSGCFLCGSDDSSVYMREVLNQNTYICDECETRLREEETNRIQKSEYIEKNTSVSENWRKYLPRVIFFRVFPSFLWIPFFGRLLAHYLPVSDASAEIPLNGSALLYTLVIFIITNFILYIYFVSTDEKSILGVLYTSAVCAVVTIIERIMAFSMSRVSLAVAEGQDSVTLVRVITHLPDYFGGPITGTTGLHVLWFPLIGLIFATLLALINANHDNVVVAI